MPRCLFGLLATSLALAACGGGHDAAEKQLADLRSEIVKLRADQAVLAERLDGIELRARPAAAQSAGAKSPGDRPELDVVKLAPDGGAADDPNSDAPRPVLRSTGRTVGVIEEPGGARKTVTSEEAGPTPAPSGKPSGKSQPSGSKPATPSSPTKSPTP